MSDASKARRLAVTAVGLVVVTWLLVVLGGAVRANGAGLACPDWPLCFGEVVPRIDFLVAFEFGHRVLAGAVSLAFLALSVGILRSAVLRARLGRLLAVTALVLVVQVVLGGLTVLELLAEWTVTSHLLAGNTFALLLLLVALELREVARPVVRAPGSPAERASAGLFALLLLAQLTLGGLVASSHAGLACGTWPSCNGGPWFPTFGGLVGLQVLHRVVAYGLLGAAVLVVVASRRRAGALGLLALVLLQAALGVANVLFRLPVEVTVLHTAGAASLVLATGWLNREAWKAPLAERDAGLAALAEGA